MSRVVRRKEDRGVTRHVYADTTRDRENIVKVGVYTEDSHRKREVIRLTLEEAMNFRNALESAIKKAESENE